MATSSRGPPQPGAAEASLPIRDGMPFKKMHKLREEVRKACENLVVAEALVANAQTDPSYPPAAMEMLLGDMRSKSAELTTLQKKLAPMEINFQKVQGKQNTPLQQTVGSPQIHPAKKRETDGSYIRLHPPRQSAVALEQMVNSATREVTSSSGPCTLTPEKCQYEHLDRLRRQYAGPFQLFCEEMDSVSDSCLTGICLALPDMPWSIAVSRLAFLLQSTLDSHDDRPHLSDARHQTAGTTVGCNVHARFIHLAEVMAIENWRDFMSWAHHHSHVINLCGQRSCIKLKHVCLEPVDCMGSRGKCQTGSAEVINDTARSPLECGSSGCWPPCLPQHSTANILHSVAIEFAAFHQVSFGPLTSAAKKDPYTAISEEQLGKLVNDHSIGLKLPFERSYGRISVTKMENGLFVNTITPLEIPSTYTWHDMQLIIPKLPSWTEMPFNDILSSIFWHARRKSMPTPVGEPWVLNCFASPSSPRYQCPFCHGFDADFQAADPLVGVSSGFRSLPEAVRHILLDHGRVPLKRKVKFLYEEVQQCSLICDTWKLILGDKFDASIASLGEGEVPKAIADICNLEPITASDPAPAVIGKESKDEEVAATRVKDEPDDEPDGHVFIDILLDRRFRRKYTGIGEALPSNWN